MSKYQLVKTKYGYYEVANKPGLNELSDYYNKKYYQNGKGAYDAGGNYTKEEISFFLNKIEQKLHAASDVCPDLGNGSKTFLDVGSGEGWALNYFSSKGWECLGLDFSEHGCARNNPGLLNSLLVGDIYSNLKSLFKEERKFDFILLDNVLEHVLDPLQMLIDVKNILSENGVLIVEVPNDFSIVQKELYDNGYVENKYWLAFPDHLSYFNKSGLKSMACDAGWNVKRTITAYPIDFNLFNLNTNYIENGSVGKSCHNSRVVIENLMHSISIEKTNKLYEALADLGMGREIIMIMT